MKTTENTPNVTPRVEAILKAAKADPDSPILVDHLTPKKRLQIALAKGWDLNAAHVAIWIEG